MVLLRGSDNLSAIIHHHPTILIHQRISSCRADPFTLGERGKVLDIADEKPIMVHIAIAEGEKFPYEMLFRSIVKHLMDAATNEYVFTKEVRASHL